MQGQAITRDIIIRINPNENPLDIASRQALTAVSHTREANLAQYGTLVFRHNLRLTHDHGKLLPIFLHWQEWKLLQIVYPDSYAVSLLASGLF